VYNCIYEYKNQVWGRLICKVPVLHMYELVLVLGGNRWTTYVHTDYRTWPMDEFVLVYEMDSSRACTLDVGWTISLRVHGWNVLSRTLTVTIHVLMMSEPSSWRDNLRGRNFACKTKQNKTCTRPTQSRSVEQAGIPIREYCFEAACIGFSPGWQSTRK
jgi:hypothetical protein